MKKKPKFSHKNALMFTGIATGSMVLVGFIASLIVSLADGGHKEAAASILGILVLVFAYLLGGMP